MLFSIRRSFIQFIYMISLPVFCMVVYQLARENLLRVLSCLNVILFDEPLGPQCFYDGQVLTITHCIFLWQKKKRCFKETFGTLIVLDEEDLRLLKFGEVYLFNLQICDTGQYKIKTLLQWLLRLINTFLCIGINWFCYKETDLSYQSFRVQVYLLPTIFWR